MIEGTYKVEFATPLGRGAGVITLIGGKVMGGDSAIAYFGDYKLDGDVFTADLTTLRHTQNPALVNAFGRDNVRITATGRFSGNTAALTATSPDAPGVQMQATLALLKQL